ncbi:MAG: protease modulator HflC [Lachnospiraceae bacterium]|nr:protease modulator HflC [Lachnospiraceae bacterium]MBR6156798.1 protease modulator HflC [Lachnospiraceae bacterium]MBR6850090.1 protease modulator HflC [Lachnospiraceae bacterium]
MKTKGKVFIIILLILAVIVGISGCYTVNHNDAVILKQFGKVVSVQNTEGLHFKIPFIQDTQAIYVGTRIYDIPQSDVITRDKKSMIADDYVIWTVTDVVKYYQTLGGVSARAEERIDAAVYNATKNTISSMTQDEVIAARGITLTDMITEESNSDMAGYGIKILTAEIKALDLPEDNKEAVYERMISERANIAAGYKAQGEAEAQKIRNETDKEVTITLANANKEAETLLAEGEAEYMRILSEAYNDPDKAEFYNFIRSLDALKESMKGDNTLILDKDSEMAKLLYGSFELKETPVQVAAPAAVEEPAAAE